MVFAERKERNGVKTPSPSKSACEDTCRHVPSMKARALREATPVPSETIGVIFVVGCNETRPGNSRHYATAA